MRIAAALVFVHIHAGPAGSAAFALTTVRLAGRTPSDAAGIAPAFAGAQGGY